MLQRIEPTINQVAESIKMGQIKYALTVYQDILESEISAEFDSETSHKLECVQYLLETINDDYRIA